MNTQNTLTLYFTPSPLGFNWDSPQYVALSAVKNKLTLKRRFMGHVYIGLKGSLSSGTPIDIVTGMSAKKLDALKRIVFSGYGLGILFHSFDGHLESKHEVWPEIDHFAQKGKLSLVTYTLNQNSFDRIYHYYNEFKKAELGRYYGFVNRPLYAEGSGCSAFGASFLTVLGLINDELIRDWTTQILIPKQLTGHPVTKNKVSLLKILAYGTNWAKKNEDHQRLDFWDPDKMHQWVLKHYHDQNSTFDKFYFKNAPGIIINKMDHVVKEQKIWRHIDKNDPLESIKPTAPYLGPWID